ncbi:hypothetical protein V6N11_063351 [Hibiscus sabdariffa]|uniref:Uncharacterized protein n=2 Tax=Hibiscus sabdariffa TaxID=183260 RepID=A0ABR1ZN52_9ROSI
MDEQGDEEMSHMDQACDMDQESMIGESRKLQPVVEDLKEDWKYEEDEEKDGEQANCLCAYLYIAIMVKQTRSEKEEPQGNVKAGQKQFLDLSSQLQTQAAVQTSRHGSQDSQSRHCY